MATVHSERMEVDGETFDVRVEAGAPGQYHFDWLSGKHSDYGFTCRTSGGQQLTQEQLVNQIRIFLELIDPDTGYIED